MSAFMVSKIHIDLLVSVAFNGPQGVPIQPVYWYRPRFDGNQLGYEQLDELGEMLIKENLSSIHTRYPDTIDDIENTPGPIEQYWLEPYKFQDRGYQLTVVEALEAIACYEYQSCEHPEWEESDAKKFCSNLRHALIRRLPGMDDAPWEWTEETLADRPTRTIYKGKQTA